LLSHHPQNAVELERRHAMDHAREGKQADDEQRDDDVSR
jgi:hypothetical protein